MNKKKKLSKVSKLVKYYSENVPNSIYQNMVDNFKQLGSGVSRLTSDANDFIKNGSSAYAAAKNAIPSIKHNANNTNFLADDILLTGSNEIIAKSVETIRNLGMKAANAKNKVEKDKLLRQIDYLKQYVIKFSNVSKQLAAEQAKTNANSATIATLQAQIKDLQKKIPQSVLQTIGMHPFTHAGAFALGYGARGFKDRWDRRVRKKGLDSDTNITGGLFNFGKAKATEIKYLNKRLNKNILSKFMTFDSNDDRVLNTNHPILRKDPQLKNMITDLVNAARQQGRYFTSDRDIAKLRKQINQVEHYMLNNYPNLIYQNSNGETNDLKNYLNQRLSAKNKTNLNYVSGDMAQALNDERIEVDKQLEPGKWRKRLQKWLA